MRSPEIQLVPFSRAHFDPQVCSNLLFEGIEVQVGVILVSVVVGVNDLRTKLAHGAAGLVRRHGVRDVDADKRDIDVLQRAHFRDIFGVAAQINAFAADRERRTSFVAGEAPVR